MINDVICTVVLIRCLVPLGLYFPRYLVVVVGMKCSLKNGRVNKTYLCGGRLGASINIFQLTSGCNMNKIILLGGILSASLLVNGCGSDASADNEPYSVIHEEDFIASGSFTSKGLKIFEDQDSYANEVLKYLGEDPTPIDFEQGRVMLIDMGLRNTGGYSFEITNSVESDSYVTITVVYSIPGENCVSASVLTNPFKFVEFYSNKEILIQEELKEACG